MATLATLSGVPASADPREEAAELVHGRDDVRGRGERWRSRGARSSRGANCSSRSRPHRAAGATRSSAGASRLFVEASLEHGGRARRDIERRDGATSREKAVAPAAPDGVASVRDSAVDVRPATTTCGVRHGPPMQNIWFETSRTLSMRDERRLDRAIELDAEGDVAELAVALAPHFSERDDLLACGSTARTHERPAQLDERRA